MDKFDSLLIRACKSKKPITRIKSLLKRKYLTDNPDYGLMICVLSNLCDKYKLFNGIESFIHARNNSFDIYFSPKKVVKFSDLQFIETSTLINKIRLSDISKFPDFIPPIKFREKNEYCS